MGICCIPPVPGEDQISPELLDARLQARRQSKAPGKGPVQGIVEEQMEVIRQLYRLELRKLVATGPREDAEVREKAMILMQKAIQTFKTGFLQGSPGEIVPFADIKEAENRLKERLSSYLQVIQFANKRKSYDLCTSVAEELMNQYKSNSRLKSKALAGFEDRAIGPMKGLCGDHLAKLLCEHEEKGESGMLTLRQKQLRVEQKMLKMIRREALQHCNEEEFKLICGSPGSSCSSDFLPASARSQMSVLDVIQRLPSIDLEDSGRKEETSDSEETGPLVLRQTQGTEESSPPYLSDDTAASIVKLD